MIVVTHFTARPVDFGDRAEQALAVLAACPGYRRGSVGRSTDDAADWLMVSEWDGVGAYRRALGRYDVKVHATPVLAEAMDLPGAFEQLVEIGPDGDVRRHSSDLAAVPPDRPVR